MSRPFSQPDAADPDLARQPELSDCLSSALAVRTRAMRLRNKTRASGGNRGPHSWNVALSLSSCRDVSRAGLACLCQAMACEKSRLSGPASSRVLESHARDSIGSTCNVHLFVLVLPPTGKQGLAVTIVWPGRNAGSNHEPPVQSMHLSYSGALVHATTSQRCSPTTARMQCMQAAIQDISDFI